MPRDILTKVYPTYSVSEMASIFDMSPQGMRDKLKRLGLLKSKGSGKKNDIYLTEILNKCPALHDSILEACQINEMIRRKNEL